MRGSKILVEGRPGSGKTTAARRLVQILNDNDVRVAGFTTEEIRERGSRVGFSIESVEGEKATLAHFEFVGPRIGKYGVDVAAFERVALPALEMGKRDTVIVIDEIGKMELLSDAFQDAILRVLDGPHPVVATIHAARHPFTDELKKRASVDTVKITRDGRDVLPAEIAARLEI